MDFILNGSLKFFIIAAGVFVLCFFKKRNRALIFNIGFIFLAIGAIEQYFITKDKDPNKTTNSPGSACDSPILGFIPAKNFVNHNVSYRGDTLLYDVKCTIDENGLRKTPPIIPNDSTKSVVFFGCSFTFGWGLNDNEVMPNIVQENVKNNYKVYNFGYNGYGPHHMLAAIEHNMVAPVLKYPPKVFIYVAMDVHYYRVLGLNCYSRNALKYELDPKTNEPICVGHFGEGLKNKIENLEIVKFFRKSNTDTQNIKLFGAIILKSKKMLLDKFPNSEFHVILWNFEDSLSKKIQRELIKNKVAIHLVSDISPNIITNPNKYCIHYPYENHPNYKANKIIANYITKKIIDKNDSVETARVEHFDSSDALDDWTIKKFSWPENACEFLESQFSIANSCLTLTLDIDKNNKEKLFKSGTAQHNHSYQYGKFTARLKNNTAPGTVTSFFLETNWHYQNVKRREVSIQFSGKNKDQVFFVVKYFKEKNKPIEYSHRINLNFNSAEAFHDYTILWKENSFSLLIDNKLGWVESSIQIEDKMSMNLLQWALFPHDRSELHDLLGDVDSKQLPSKIYVDYISYKP